MDIRYGIRAGAAAALALAAWASVSAQQGGSDQVPTFRSGTELVTVDVGVVDRQGRPVQGLSPQDFTVSVAGRPRRVVSAEFIDASAARGSAEGGGGQLHVSTNEGAGVGRQFVFLVDQNTLDAGNVRHVAQATSRFFEGLSFADRSALMLIPTGPNIEFTWAHERIQQALLRVNGLASPIGRDEFPSLTEARDIASRNPIALRMVAQRECGGGMSASAGGGDAFGVGSAGGSRDSGPGPTSSPGGPTQGGGESGGSGQGGSGGGQPAGGAGGGGGSTQSAPRSTAAPGMGRSDGCTRDLQMRADFAWRTANMTSLASLTALRQALDALARVPGDKIVVLISGGWPLEEREQTSMLTLVADEAASARATIFTVFTPSVMASAARRTISYTPGSDQQLYSWPLEQLAGMTGGAYFRGDVGAEQIFDRIARQLSGYYRLGVEKEPVDGDARQRRMKVAVRRNSVTVRARSVFDVRTFQDRNWAARLAGALEGPMPATAVGLAVTSYLAADDEDPRRMKLMLAGEASRVDPGDASFQLLVRDMEGRKILAGEQPLGEPVGDGLFFSANVTLAPGRYVLRIAVIDGAGRVGSVDHRVDVHPSAIGPFAATGPLLVRVPGGDAQPRVVMNTIRQDERLAMQVDLEGESERLGQTDVAFEILPNAGGPALVTTKAAFATGSRPGAALAQGITDLRVLPPGEYILRARFTSGSQPLGELRRPFTLLEAPHAAADASTGDAVVPSLASTRPSFGSFARVPGFTVEQVLAPDVRAAFLDRVAARHDASSPMIRDLIARARTQGLDDLFISETLAAEYPVVAFLKGLSLLAQRRLEPAAQAFRSAMRASADFYPAMVYLGACYAAGGNDKEAAGAWRTALIKEGNTPALHLLLGEALLRQARGDMARQTLEAAHTRWPDDDGVKRRYVVAALQDGQAAAGLRALDELVARDAADEPALAAGLLVLFEAFSSGKPIESAESDRERMEKLAEAYRAHGGPSLPLIEAWLTAAAPNAP